jgi:hypothetical protein
MPTIPSEPKNMNEVQEVEYTTEQLIAEFGNPKIASRERANQLCSEGKQNFLFCVMNNGGNPLGPDYGETGMHIVNVMERYEFDKELPAGLYVDEVDYGLFP